MAAVLALPDRRQQIIQLTIRVAMCLDPEARSFLADCQAGLIEGGLEAMRRRRQELLASLERQEVPEAIVIVDSSEDQLLEQVGAALDALRLSEIARQVFPDVREKHETWEVARALLADEEAVRKILVDAVRAHGAGNSALYEDCRKELLGRLEAARPSWMSASGALKQASSEGGSEHAADVFGVVAVDDMRARLVLDLLAESSEEAHKYLGEIRRRIQLLRELEAREKA
ncbi:MAG: hypothetical protein ACK44W_07695 [Planctomycetota bacterium]